jgi:hypothetical protein
LRPLPEQHLPRGIQLLGKILRPTQIRARFIRRLLGRANFLFGRPCFYFEDFEGLRGADIAGRRIALTLLLLYSRPLPSELLPCGLRHRHQN